MFVTFEFVFECVQLSVMQVAEPCNLVWFPVVVVMHFAAAAVCHALRAATFPPLKGPKSALPQKADMCGAK
jgi:hypothetical protein